MFGAEVLVQTLTSNVLLWRADAKLTGNAQFVAKKLLFIQFFSDTFGISEAGFDGWMSGALGKIVIFQLWEKTGEIEMA